MQKLPRITLVVSLLLIAGLAYLGFNAEIIDGRERGDLLKFLGRFHPLILHLPVGFLVLLGVFEYAGNWKRFDYLKKASGLVLGLSVITVMIAVATGYLLAYSHGSAEAAVIAHMRFGVVLGILSLILLVVKAIAAKSVQRYWGNLYQGVLGVTLLVLFVVGHQGGSITHGEDYLTKHMPNPLRVVFGLPVKEREVIYTVQEIKVYEHLVEPVFEQNCMSCHNPSKKEGGLDMTTLAGMRLGGDSGIASYVAGDVKASELYRRITLDPEHEEYMPTEGKPPLSEDEVNLLAWWITEAVQPGVTIAAITDIPVPIFSYAESAFLRMLSPEELQKIVDERNALYVQAADLNEELGILLGPMEPDSFNLRLETFSVQNVFDDTALTNLEPIAHRIVSADLSGTQITDAALEVIGAFENLSSLNISNTGINGENLEYLVGLSKLKNLNLFNSQIDMASIAYLSQLQQLETLYIYNTPLSNAPQIEELVTALPNTQIVYN